MTVGKTDEIKQELARKAENTKAGTKLKKSMSIADMIKVMEPQIKKALPEVITPERFTRMALSALNTTPKLNECTPILYCDASGDYSIKIIVKTQNGKQRPRVLKLRKLYLTVDGECLEDIYQERMESNNA